MNEVYNPFKANRTEQMNELWKYYVPFFELGPEGKPFVVEGGRGSGKTMLFQCNSWRQKIEQYKKDGGERPFIDYIDFVGIYYRVDTTFVASMKGQEDKNWDSIFNSYLSVCFLKEISLFLLHISKEVQVERECESNFVKKYSARIKINNESTTFDELYSLCDKYLDYIEDIINGEEYNKEFRFVNTKRFIDDICIDCGLLLKKTGLIFKIFIDEYETLLEYQQRIINTLIKHSTLPIIYNIGLRPKGMKTQKTISDTEIIESPHDFELFVLGVDKDKYPELLKNICKKRIQTGKNRGDIPQDASDNIEDYLGYYSLEEELKILEKASTKRDYLNKLEDIIRNNAAEEGENEASIKKFIKALCEEAPLINSRIHYAMLCKKTLYTPSVRELYEEYINNSSSYKEWIHNKKNGAIYLLCKELKRKKLYYGFDVYTALSSSIVRYFLELCDRAFTNAFMNGFEWDRKITFDEQSEAARYVSEYKVMDIASYEPFGGELRIFIQYLGKIFYYLHVKGDNTLGEPEPNHFYTKDLSMSDRIKSMINSAVMWNVLQEGEPTKMKQAKLSPETVDYYINKIYVPYFGISYRNQRKIMLSPEVLEMLLCGDESKAQNGYKSFFKTQGGLNLGINDQMTLFDGTWGGE